MDATAAIKRIKALSAEGELLGAVDLARAEATTAMAEGRDEDHDKIRIEEVLALARLASLSEAQKSFRDYGLDKALDPAARSLWARIKKDLGFAADDDPERRRLLGESRDLYAEIAEEEGDRAQFEYNAINAVTLAHLLGDGGKPKIAELMGRLAAEAPLDTYYSWATRAELLINQGASPAAVRSALQRARESEGADVAAMTTTLRQLSRIEQDNPALDVLRPGPVMHYTGHMIAAPGARVGRVLAANEETLRLRIVQAFEEIAPSATYGSLASGADILIVEEAQRRGIETRIFLPFAREDFVLSSIAPAGGDWAARAAACLASPHARVQMASEAPKLPGDDLAFAMVSRLAMGSAILRAAQNLGRAVQLAVWDGIETMGVAGAAADRREWLAAGRPAVVIDVSDLGAGARSTPRRARTPERAPVALVFGDVKNFSKLSEAQLPVFVDNVMGAISASLRDAVDVYGHTSLAFRNTWGDGVFAVFTSASAAAHFTLSLQIRMKKLDLARLHLPKELMIRLGLHFGPAYERIEPVTGLRNFFGEAVARAARIEPITDAGRIFVSEEFAAELALDPDSPAIAEYVGTRETHKKYGRFRLYSLRASGQFLNG